MPSPFLDDDTLLFSDERARVIDVVRERFAKQTLAPVDLLRAPELAAFDALVAAGRLREGGPMCAVPPSLDRVVSARFPDAQLIAVDLLCTSGGACTARAELRRWVRKGDVPYWGLFPEWEPLARMVAPVASAADVSLFERAVRDASIVRFEWEKRDHYARPWLKSQLASAVANLAVRLASDRWASPPSGADFAPERAAIEACVAQKNGRLEATIAVDDTGAVTRCEATGAPAMTTCACAALTAHRFAAGAANRRVGVQLVRASKPGPLKKQPWETKRFTPGARPNAMVFLASDSDIDTSDAIQLSKIGAPLTACFKRAATASEEQIQLGVDRDDGGHVVDVQLASAALDRAEIACVQAALRTLVLPCPLSDAGRHIVLDLDVAR